MTRIPKEPVTKNKILAGKSVYLTRNEMIEIQTALEYQENSEPTAQAAIDSALSKMQKALR